MPPVVGTDVQLTPLADRLAAYAGLAERLGESAVVAVVLFLVGRLVVVPLVMRTITARRVERTLKQALGKLLRGAVVVVALAGGVAAGGFTAFLGGSALIVAALTLAVGFAAQDVISNFVSGIFIVNDRNFSIDDWIEWDDQAGIIEDIGFRTTRVRTFDNELITVPNTLLATTAVKNRMSKDALRVSYSFGIGYDDDIDEATRHLLAVADELDGVLDEPEPSVRVTELGDSAIVLQSRIWIDDPDRADFSVTRSEYIQQVSERFEAAGIDLSTTSQHSLTGELDVERVDQ
jgi:small-conductance mechanosensitive channel